MTPKRAVNTISGRLARIAALRPDGIALAGGGNDAVRRFRSKLPV